MHMAEHAKGTTGNNDRKRFEAAIESTLAKWVGRIIMPVMGVAITAMAGYIGSQLVARIEDQTGAISRLGDKFDATAKEFDGRLDSLESRVTRTETNIEYMREQR